MAVRIKLSPALSLTLTLPETPRKECPKSVAERANPNIYPNTYP